MTDVQGARPETRNGRRMSGIGRVLVAVYGVLALAAVGRSFFQIVSKFEEAPLAYVLSALAAVVYVVATAALILSGRGWYRVAWVTIAFEFTGVVVVGLLSVVFPDLFPDDTVWSWFGRGYLFIPLVLPVLGMWWLAKHRPVSARCPERGGCLVKTFKGLAAVPEGFGPSAVTIGKFDGVHRGHRAVIDRIRAIAARDDLRAVVVTFDRNPLELLAPEKCPDALVSVRQKLELLGSTGIDATLLLPFDRALASVPATEFVERVLVDTLHAKAVLVGSDFRYGARGAGDVDLLIALGAKFGFTVEVVDDVRPEDERRVSSTWIRELLAEGDVRHATQLLGHTPTVSGIVVHGAKRGRELGFPTANLSPESEGLIPADGVYAGWLTDAGTRYPAAISVGNNPTYEGVRKKQVEAYVLDRELDLYDHVVDVEFVDRLRGQVAFTNIPDLVETMRGDVDRARDLLAD
jgi:riboflavin kinase/FMN adenylyltransferase